MQHYEQDTVAVTFSCMQRVMLSCLLLVGLLLIGLLGSSSVYAKTILVMGDSISAGYGMQASQSWVSLLQKRLDAQFPKRHNVLNASVSGETTSGGLARLPSLLQKHRPQVVLLELGANDALRGQPPQMIYNNLAQMIQKSQKAGAKVVLLGMRIPPNYGSTYSKAFEQNYVTLSRQYKVKLLPFLLEGVAGNKNLMQADGLHPNVKAQPKILDLAYPLVLGALK